MSRSTFEARCGTLRASEILLQLATLVCRPYYNVEAWQKRLPMALLRDGP